jgi:lipoprotein-anchoring transpeptidase ErfK/SrfK
MPIRRAAVTLATTLVLSLIASIFLVACGSAQPTLSASVPDGAQDVPISTDLKVSAKGAILQTAVLERIDAPGEQMVLNVAETEARLTGKLDPDAQYRLVATAQAQEATPLPWQSRAMLSLERVFSTVHTPALTTSGPLAAFPNKPIELRFSEPIAKANVQASGHSAEAQVARDDPHVLRVLVKDPVPGQELTLRVTDVVGANGAPADDLRLSVHTPEAVALASVGGVTAPGRVQLPTDRPLAVSFSRPVTAFKYTVDEEAKGWTGEANATIRLPVRSEPGRTVKVTINEATAEDGGWLAAAQSYEVVAPPPLRVAATWPENGATNISLTGDPTIRFSEPISDQEAAEAAIVFDPPVAGSFQWLTRDRVRFLPSDKFPRQTDVTMTVKSGPEGVRGESGAPMESDVTVAFQTGRNKVIDVQLGRQILTLFEDDEAVWSAPVATGVRGAETPPGTYQVSAKMPIARFRGVNPNGSRYDIPDVHWVLAFYGDYTIHGAYWRSNFGTPGSNGCVSLTDTNAKRVFDFADEGTTVVIRR